MSLAFKRDTSRASPSYREAVRRLCLLASLATRQRGHHALCLRKAPFQHLGRQAISLALCSSFLHTHAQKVNVDACRHTDATTWGSKHDRRRPTPMKQHLNSLKSVWRRLRGALPARCDSDAIGASGLNGEAHLSFVHGTKFICTSDENDLTAVEEPMWQRGHPHMGGHRWNHPWLP